VTRPNGCEPIKHVHGGIVLLAEPTRVPKMTVVGLPLDRQDALSIDGHGITCANPCATILDSTLRDRVSCVGSTESRLFELIDQ